MGRGPKYLLLAAPGRDKMSSGKISHFNFGCYLYWKGSGILVFGSSRAGKMYPGATCCFRMASATPKNQQNSTPQSLKNDFCKNVVFAIPSMQKMYPGATFCFRMASPTPKNRQNPTPQSVKNDFCKNVVFEIPPMQKMYPGAIFCFLMAYPTPKNLLNSTPQSLKNGL